MVGATPSLAPDLTLPLTPDPNRNQDRGVHPAEERLLRRLHPPDCREQDVQAQGGRSEQARNGACLPHNTSCVRSSHAVCRTLTLTLTFPQEDEVTEPHMTALLSEATRLLELISTTNNTGGVVSVILTQGVGWEFYQCPDSGKFEKILSTWHPSPSLSPDPSPNLSSNPSPSPTYTPHYPQAPTPAPSPRPNPTPQP
eukprot:scaffold23684_cov69-Phaeocystis_antarctica.AAC.7